MLVLRIILLRLAQSVPLLLAVSAVTFFLIFASPGSYINHLRAENPNMSDAELRLLAKRLGIPEGQKWYATYGEWLWGVATRGDLGRSFVNNEPVSKTIGRALGATFLLGAASMAIAWTIAVPLGIIAALRRNTAIDYLASGIAFLGLSLPPVVLALFALVLASTTGWFPIGKMTSINHHNLPTAWARAIDIAHHLILPACVLAAGSLATLTRQMRSNLLETLQADFVRTARSKGRSYYGAVFRHALRNAINPLITIFGFSVAGLLSGAFLVEQIMQWPGLGYEIYNAFVRKDMYVVAVGVIMGTVMLILGNLVSDLLLALNDPRIRLE